MTKVDPLEKERRDYFRKTGIIYLLIESNNSKAPSIESEPKSALDDIALKIMNLKSRIKYNEPDQSDYLLDIIEVLDLTHLVVIQSKESKSILAKSIRQPVVISGSGLDLHTSTQYTLGDIHQLHITFPDYPFMSVSPKGVVVRCSQSTEDPVQYHVAFEFSEIKETERDVIIKFVNHLQRKTSTRNS